MQLHKTKQKQMRGWWPTCLHFPWIPPTEVFLCRLLSFRSFPNGEFLTNLCTSASSHSRVSIRSCHSFSRSGVCCDPCLRRWFSHHLRVWHAPQGPPWWGMEVGRLQRGCGVWKHGFPRVCWCERESPGCTFSHEPPQQWGRKNGTFSNCSFCRWCWGSFST